MSDYYEKLAQMREAARLKEREYSEDAVENVGIALDGPSNYVRDLLMGEGIPYYAEGDVIHRPSAFGMQGPEVLTEESAAAQDALMGAALDPYNALGMGLFTGGVKYVKNAKEAADSLLGSNSARGMGLNNYSNYIENWYGLTDLPPGAQPSLFDVGLSKVTPLDPEQAQAMTAKVKGFTKWLAGGTSDVVRTLLDPKSQALYREKGITTGSQRHVGRAIADNKIHKGTAQVQYGSHIGQQAGREGSVAESATAIMEKSGVTDYFAYKPGLYKETIREGGYVPTQDGSKTPISNNSLDIIEKHFGNVWDAPDAKGAKVPFKDAESPIVMIKAPGNSTFTGDHYNDLVKAGGWVGDVYTAFRTNKGEPTVEQLWSHLKKVSDKNIEFNKNKKRSEKGRWMLKEDSDTLEKAKKNGIWITGSKQGRAYTEGGINYLHKIQPNGNVLSIMSDEHNFFESLLGKGDKVARVGTLGVAEEGFGLISQLEEVLPNRLVAVTPPMQSNIYNLRTQLGKKGPAVKNVTTGKGQVSKDDLQSYVDEVASPEAIRAQQAIQRGRMLQGAGAGMLTGNEMKKERERGP
jgi:Tfp pilus assembly protein PilP